MWRGGSRVGSHRGTSERGAHAGRDDALEQHDPGGPDRCDAGHPRGDRGCRGRGERGTVDSHREHPGAGMRPVRRIPSSTMAARCRRRFRRPRSSPPSGPSRALSVPDGSLHRRCAYGWLRSLGLDPPRRNNRWTPAGAVRRRAQAGHAPASRGGGATCASRWRDNSPTPPGARGRPGFGGRFAVALSGPGLVREGGGAGAGAASRLRRGARPGRIFMRLSFCGLWTQNDERVGLGGPRWPSGAPSFVMTTAPEGVRWLSSRPRLGRAFEPTGYALHRKRFARPRRRRVPAPPNGGAPAARRHHPGRPCPRYGSLHRKRCSLAARHGRPRARPA
jgi:hypothetical protein